MNTSDLIQGLARTKLPAEDGSIQGLLPAQQRVTGRANPNPNPNSLYAQGSDLRGPDSIISVLCQLPTVQWPPHLPQQFLKRGYLTLYRILPAPCSCQRKHSSTLHCPLQAVPEGVENVTPATRHDRREEPGSQLLQDICLFPSSFSYLIHHVSELTQTSTPPGLALEVFLFLLPP